VSVRTRLALFGVGAAAALALVVWGLSGIPGFGHYGGSYGYVLNRVALPERHATNVVASVVFDYRGFDTVGEEFILFVSVMAVSLLLRIQRDERERPPRDRAAERTLAGTSDAVRVAGVGLIGPAVLIGLYIVAHGHTTPGGGFQGGAILAAAPMLIYLVGRYLTFRRLNPIHALDVGEGAGAGGFVVVGLIGLVAGIAFLDNIWPKGQPGSVFSAGTLPVLNVSVGLEVGAGLVLILFEFLEQTLMVRGR